MTPRLGVNIDHVATLRQARGEPYPSVVDAARISLEAGADQITIHLREDRRHIQDTDLSSVLLVTKSFEKPLNLEIGAAEEIVDIAIATMPDWICLVPENREERTTEGGLNLLSNLNYIKIEKVVKKLQANIQDIKISLFVEGNLDILKLCTKLGVDAVEIHTGDYAREFLNGEDYSQYIEDFKKTQLFCNENGLKHHAGHGLTNESVKPLLAENLFEEYNIGHWIISQAIFSGLENVVSDLKETFN